MKRVAVLGAGLVGRLIAKDLARDPSLRVRSCDRSEPALAELRRGTSAIETATADLTRPDEVARSKPGIHPPEVLGADAAITERILSELAARGVRIRRTNAP